MNVPNSGRPTLQLTAGDRTLSFRSFTTQKICPGCRSDLGVVFQGNIRYGPEKKSTRSNRIMECLMLYRVLTALTVIIFITSGCATVMALEETEYTVMLKDGDFELRRYKPHIVAETHLEGDFDEVGSVGFRRLYKYISGNNRPQKDIAMTAPVGQTNEAQEIAMTAPVSQDQADGHWRVTFMMPAEFTLATLPEPLDPEVKLRQAPARLMAAYRYSGTWSRTRYLEREKLLREWLEANGLREAGSPVFARYDPPFMPWFLRRNEVLIPVEKISAS